MKTSTRLVETGRIYIQYVYRKSPAPNVTVDAVNRREEIRCIKPRRTEKTPPSRAGLESLVVARLWDDKVSEWPGGRERRWSEFMRPKRRSMIVHAQKPKGKSKPNIQKNQENSTEFRGKGCADFQVVLDTPAILRPRQMSRVDG